jgi:hypothetical protein
MIDVRRYLLVLDRDLLAVDEQCELGPISYLAAQQEHEQLRRRWGKRLIVCQPGPARRDPAPAS